MHSDRSDDSRFRVLVVDDDHALTRTLADILQLHGYAPSTAGTGREGLEMAEQHEPILAVVDLRLPDMDGMELVTRLHALSALTEVVVLTGNATVESAVAALREHSVDYLLKPVKVEQLLHVVSLASERWQRRQAEERLRDSDERFRRVVESDMIGIMFWDADGSIYDANESFLRMIGRSRADIDAGALRWTDITPPEFAALDRKKFASLAKHGLIAPYEKAFLTSAGLRVPVLFGAATLRGRHERGVSFVLDITERKTAERALRARERQQTAVADFGQRALVTDDLGALFDESVVLVAETLELPLSAIMERRSDGASLLLRAGIGWDGVDVGSSIVEINEQTQAGYTLLHNKPTILADLVAAGPFTLSPLMRSRGITSGISVVIPGPVRAFGVLSAHDRSAREFTVDDVHFMQAIAHVLGAAVERSRTESALRQTQRLEAVGRLASGISHDFNNVLAAITGFGELVQARMPSDDPLREDVAEILKAAGHAATLTRQLLAFSRQQVLQSRTILLNDIVASTENLLRRLLGPEIEFCTRLAPDLWLVRADPGQLEQVILNLCVNARDAMPSGGTLSVETRNVAYVGIEARARALDAPGEYVLLTVSDTGTGMDADTAARIFEPFFTTKAVDKGTGLGLATVYGIVKQSGGESSVHSELGHGTTFMVYLPRGREDASGRSP